MPQATELVDQLDRARQAMRAALADADVRHDICAGWTIKHVVAHIAGWDDVCIAALRAHRGGEPSMLVIESIDQYNAQSVAAREAQSFEQVVGEWEEVRETFKRLILEMPPDKLQARMQFPWGQSGTVERLVAIFVHHELEHAREIEAVAAGA